jgi:hypothetical protein
MMTNMNKFQSCRLLLVALWNLWKNHLANNFHLWLYLLHYLYNLLNLNMQNNLDNHYMLNLHNNLLAFLRLNNNDDDMNGKKLWCCQDHMVLQQLLPCRELHHIHNEVFKMKKMPSTPLTWTFTTRPSCLVDGRLQMATWS